MTKPTAIFAAALVAVTGALALADTSGSGTAPSPAASAAATATVTIENFAFSPKKLTIAPGTAVTFINKDQIEHSATADKDKSGNVAFDSGELSQNKTYKFTFKKAGTYTYGCTYHPMMHGKIVVSAAAGG